MYTYYILYNITTCHFAVSGCIVLGDSPGFSHVYNNMYPFVAEIILHIHLTQIKEWFCPMNARTAIAMYHIIIRPMHTTLYPAARRMIPHFYNVHK